MSLRLHKIQKSFGTNLVLDDFSIEFQTNQISCLFGPSGCGKTSILNIISGIQSFNKGIISGKTEAKVSYIFQDNRLIPNISALENVEIVISKDKEKFNNAYNILVELGLKDELNKLPRDLSGGACQRVNIARALAFDADILLMDEPFSSLDSANIQKSMDLIKKYSQNRISVLVTHSKTEALLLSDKIYILSDKPAKILNIVEIQNSYEYRRKNKSSFLEEYQSIF